MVYYFTSNVVNPPTTLFMGENKYENEELIKWGWPEDVWFHVDKLSSAHVYLRLNENQSIDDIPSELIEDCAQLVKANSIKGCKMNNIDVIYTMWSNLKKTNDMVEGQVNFFDEKAIKKVKIERKNNAIINRLNKTKSEKKSVDFRQEREQRNKLEREKNKQIEKNRLLELEKEKIEKQELAKLKSYDNLMKDENMLKSNKDYDSDLSDDFM